MQFLKHFFSWNFPEQKRKADEISEQERLAKERRDQLEQENRSLEHQAEKQSKQLIEAEQQKLSDEKGTNRVEWHVGAYAHFAHQSFVFITP